MRTKLNFFARYALRRRSNQPRIMESQIAERKTYAIEEIESEFHRQETLLLEYAEELQTRISKSDEQLIYTDEWKITRKYEVPIMKPNEAAQAKKNNRNWLFSTIILFTFDSFFGSLVTPFILHTGNEVVNVILGACVAFLVIICCEVGFKNLALYFDGRMLLAKGELSEDDKPKVHKKLVAAIGFISAGVLATFLIAMVRFAFLETVTINTGPHSVLVDQLNEKLNIGSKYASGATFILAFIVVGLFAYFSTQKNKFAIRYRLYKRYSKNEVKISRLTNNISKTNTFFWYQLKDNLESAWSLMLDTRRVLKRIVDEEHASKEVEFKEVVSQKGFQINDDVYRVYEPIASCNRELFLYGIEESKEIRTIRDAWNTHMIRINTMIELYKNTHHYDHSKPAAKNLAFSSTANLMLLFFGLALLTSCNSATKLNIIVFPDKSGSVDTTANSYYLRMIGNLLTQLKPGTSIRVLPVYGSTEKSSVELLNVTIPSKAYFENDMDPPSQKDALEKVRFTAFKDSVSHVVQSQLKNIATMHISRKDQMETDILGAFRLLNRYQITGDSSTKNVVLFLSDMMNCDHELDIEHHAYTESVQQKIISELPKENLSNWHVLVLTGESKRSSEKYLQIKDFWKDYLAENGNHDLIYESGATSVIFDKLQQLGQPVPSKLPYF